MAPGIRCERCGKRLYRFPSDQRPAACPACGYPLGGWDDRAVEEEVRTRLYGAPERLRRSVYRR